MKSVMKVLFVCLLSALSFNATAVTINGSFGVIGGLSTAGGTDLSNMTDISLLYVLGSGVSAGDTSDVTLLSENWVAGSVTSLVDFVPVSGFLDIEGWSLELTSLSIIDQTIDLLTLEGTGVLSGGAYDPTDAIWSFSTTSTESYSMSVQTAVVPVPATIWLLGSGLIGLAGVVRRKA